MWVTLASHLPLLIYRARRRQHSNGREYGNGLSKFEPNDLNKGMMLDLRLLSDNDKQEIEKPYRKIQDGDDSAVSSIDNLLRRVFWVDSRLLSPR